MNLLFVEHLGMLLGFYNVEGAHAYSPMVCYSSVYVLLAMPTKVVLVAE